MLKIEILEFQYVTHMQLFDKMRKMKLNHTVLWKIQSGHEILSTDG